MSIELCFASLSYLFNAFHILPLSSLPFLHFCTKIILHLTFPLVVFQLVFYHSRLLFFMVWFGFFYGSSYSFMRSLNFLKQSVKLQVSLHSWVRHTVLLKNLYMPFDVNLFNTINKYSQKYCL